MKLIESTIGQLLRQNALNFGDREAVVFCDNDFRLNWQDLDETVDQVARSLMALNVGKGDRIAMWGTDVPEWLFIQLAAARIGAVLVTINPEWKLKELEYVLSQSGTNVLVMIPGFEKKTQKKSFVYDYIKMIRELCPGLGTPACRERLPNLRNIILTSEGPVSDMLSWPQFLILGTQISRIELEARTDRVNSKDTVMIQYTSGTTGFPKGVMLTHYNVVNNARAVATGMKLKTTDRLCGPVPFYHCFGSIILNLGCLVSGATLIIPSGHFNSRQTLKAIEGEKCTALYGVPTMFIAELDEMDFEAFDLHSLRTGIMAGAPVDKELYEAVSNKMGAKEMIIAYGLTEASPVTHQTSINDPIEKRATTVGRPIEHTESKVVDPETFRELGINELGEIWVKGYHLMRAYYKKPKETAEAIVGGWLRTGDLGFVDEAGFYHIAGRLKEMIIVGGHNVYSAEVEQALHSLLEDKVEMVQIVGVPHSKLQEVVALAVKCLPGKTLTLEEVKERCENKLEWPKIPHYLKVMDDFSKVMTVTGKIQKFKLAKLMAQEMDQSKAAEGQISKIAS